MDPAAIGVIGDSLTYQYGRGGADITAELVALGWQSAKVRVDGLTGRAIPGAETVLDGWRAAGFDPGVLLIALGTNNRNATEAQWDSLIGSVLTKIGAGRTIVWVNLGFRNESDSRVLAFNTNLASIASGRTDMTAVDWNAYVHQPAQAAVADWDPGDLEGIHQLTSGYRATRNPFYRQSVAPYAPGVQAPQGFKSSSTAVGSNNGTVTVPFPAGAAAGDVMLVLGNGNSGTATLTASRGVLLAGGPMSAGWSGLWAKELTSGDITAGTVVLTSSEPTNRLTGAVCLYSAVIVPTSTDVARAVEGATATTSHGTPSLTTTVAGYVVSIAADRSSFNTAWTVPAGEIRRAEAYTGLNGSTSLVVTDTGLESSAGTHGGKTFIATASSTNAATYTVLLRTRAAAEIAPPAVVYAAERVHLDAYACKSTGRTPTWQLTTAPTSGGVPTLDVTDPWRPFFYRPQGYAQPLVWKLRVTDDSSGLFSEAYVDVPADAAVEVLTAGTDGVFR